MDLHCQAEFSRCQSEEGRPAGLGFYQSDGSRQDAREYETRQAGARTDVDDSRRLG
jgi:hypothetical protein